MLTVSGGAGVPLGVGRCGLFRCAAGWRDRGVTGRVASADRVESGAGRRAVTGWASGGWVICFMIVKAGSTLQQPPYFNAAIAFSMFTLFFFSVMPKA